MPEYAWPDSEHRVLIGQALSRIDASSKVSGHARYTADVKRPEMLFGKILRCPYPHARVLCIDTSIAARMPGVRAIHVIHGAGSTIYWAGDDLVAVAAVDQLAADDAVRAIKVKYERLPHLVSDVAPVHPLETPLSMDDINDRLDDGTPVPELVRQIQRYGIAELISRETLKTLTEIGVDTAVLDAVQNAKLRRGEQNLRSHYQKAPAQVEGQPEQAFAAADVVVEGMYGASPITHCCLESHGSISEWTGSDQLLVHISTQNVSGIAGQMAEALDVPAANIHVHQDNIGGGFGSKFSPDRWGVATAEVSRKADGKPVRTLLERDDELKVAGARASASPRTRS